MLNSGLKLEIKGSTLALDEPYRVKDALEDPRPLRKWAAIGIEAAIGIARPLKKHQTQAVIAIHEMGHTAILADEMGLGKTATAIAAAHLSGAERVLVICPASVKFNWPAEIWETLDRGALVIDGTPKLRAKLFEMLWQTQFTVINYDLLPYLKEDQRQALGRADYLICDESQYLKSKDAKRTKAVLKLSKGIDRRLLLSGTPILDTVEDIWSQVEICRPGTWTSYSNFVARYLIRVPVQMGNRKAFMQVRGTKNLDQLNAVINTMQIRRKKEEVMNLPPKIHTYPELEMDKGTRKVYETMRDYAVLELRKLSGDTPIFKPQARSAVEAAMRCEQIASGFIGGIPEDLVPKLLKTVATDAENILGRPNELAFPKAPKLVWLREKIDQILMQDGRPIVFSRYLAPLHWLRHQYFLQSSIIHGGVASKDRQDILDEFQNSQIPILLCQVQCAVGFTATRSQDVIFLSRDWSPARNAQAEDRTHRIGTKGTVNIQIPIVRGTIEVKIHKALQAKADDAEAALKKMTISDLVGML